MCVCVCMRNQKRRSHTATTKRTHNQTTWNLGTADTTNVHTHSIYFTAIIFFCSPMLWYPFGAGRRRRLRRWRVFGLVLAVWRTSVMRIIHASVRTRQVHSLKTTRQSKSTLNCSWNPLSAILFFASFVCFENAIALIHVDIILTRTDCESTRVCVETWSHHHADGARFVRNAPQIHRCYSIRNTSRWFILNLDGLGFRPLSFRSHAQHKRTIKKQLLYIYAIRICTMHTFITFVCVRSQMPKVYHSGEKNRTNCETFRRLEVGALSLSRDAEYALLEAMTPIRLVLQCVEHFQMAHASRTIYVQYLRARDSLNRDCEICGFD